MKIRTIENIVEQACKKETNISGYGIWSHHIIYVVKYAKLLAQKLGADVEVVELAALLHDYAGISNKEYMKEHHIHGMDYAQDILSRLNYPQEKIDLIKKCIFSHRGSVIIERTTPEEVCIASADAMAHIDQVVSLLYAVYKEKGFGIDEGRVWVKDKLERSWNKLCPDAKKIIKEKYLCVKKVLE